MQRYDRSPRKQTAKRTERAEAATRKLRADVARRGVDAPGKHDIALVTEYLAERFPEHGHLVGWFAASEYARPPAPKEDGLLRVEGMGDLSARLFQRWVLAVLEIGVRVFPAGRVQTYRQGAPYMLEHYFERAAKGDIRITGETRVLWAEGARPAGTIHLHEHLAAVRISLEHHDLSAFKKMPRRQPKRKPGESLPTTHYRAVLDAYEALVAAGESRPTAKLAERYGTNRNTIKSWLRRGRIYLGDQREGG